MVDAYLPQLTNSVNYSFQHNNFPQELKRSKAIPLYKKLDSLPKENYRPVSLLPHISKIFKRIIHKQITSYTKVKLNSCITGMQKSHGTQHSLVVILEKWKRATDKGECVLVLFMDFSKAFDTINRNLMITKLKAYGFSREVSKFMQSYSKNRKQRVQINNKFSFKKDAVVGVTQGSIDGLLPFNLFLNYLVFFIHQSTISNYVDDNNLFVSEENIERTSSLLCSNFKILCYLQFLKNLFESY